MKKLIFIALFYCCFSTLFAQVTWVDNMPEAQVLSMNKNKLILLDFWASWCGPCKKMDSQLWNTTDINAVADNFVAFKVDVDIHQDLALKYGVKAIPTVILMTAKGDVIWKKTDFSSATAYLKYLKAIPKDISHLNQALTPLLQENESIENFIAVGNAFQQMGMEIEDKTFKAAFFRWSNTYYKLARKKGGNATLEEESALLSILNEAYKGNTKKVRKKLDKLKIDQENPKLVELTQFIRAYCAKCEGDDKIVNQIKTELTNEDYLAQLKD